jgi:hypothetical protein
MKIVIKGGPPVVGGRTKTQLRCLAAYVANTL